MTATITRNEDARRVTELRASSCSPAAERRLPVGRPKVWKGLLRPFPAASDDDTRHDLRVAYIWSSEEAATVAAARERALGMAEAALGRVRNGLGGRYSKASSRGRPSRA
jgi:hypothetical protein